MIHPCGKKTKLRRFGRRYYYSHNHRLGVEHPPATKNSLPINSKYMFSPISWMQPFLARIWISVVSLLHVSCNYQNRLRNVSWPLLNNVIPNALLQGVSAVTVLVVVRNEKVGEHQIDDCRLPLLHRHDHRRRLLHLASSVPEYHPTAMDLQLLLVVM